PPDPIAGALDAVRAAAERGPVALISDSGISPGSSLLKLLERNGFTDYLQVCVFSDEVGVAKPQAAMFHCAASGMRVDLDSILHIGDLEPTDIAGALNCGARAALFGGDNERYVGKTKAHHTFTEWRTFCEKLPDLC
ncbi:MAG: HAD family hydrolase, partial [Candidatus Hydrogenedentales bacterium]